MVPALDGPEDWLRLIAAARQGDLAAFEALMRRHERLVLATALRLLGRMEDAQDASQEVFLRLHRNLGRLGDEVNLAAWLYRVTVNVCRDIRRRSPENAPLDEGNRPSPGADQESTYAEGERRRALQLSLGLLSGRQREALVLRDLEGLSTEEVARAMGSSVATVRSQISQARVKIRNFLERYLGRRS